METVIPRPPQYNAAKWDGTNQNDFAEYLDIDNAIVSGDKVILLSGSFSLMIAQGEWLVATVGNRNLSVAIRMSDELFQAQYMPAP